MSSRLLDVRAIALAGVLVLAAAVTVLLRAGAATADPRDRVAAPSAPALRGLATAPAGEPLAVELTGLGDAPVEVLVSGTAGVVTVVATPVDGAASVVVPPALVRVRGTLTFHVGDVLVGAVEVTPGPAVDPVGPYVGPRSIVTGGDDHTMLTVVPLDAHGNPVAAGTPIEVSAVRPDGGVEQREVVTDGLLAWVRVPSADRAGRTELRATTPGATGPVADVLEVAGPPVAITLGTAVAAGRADGRRVVTVSTDVLRDRLGNLLTDGTSVVFDLRGPDGAARVPAVTVAGIARVDVRVPERAGAVTVTAHVDRVASTALVLTFASAVAELPVRVDATAEGAVVSVGPVLDPLGTTLPDGTPVRVTADGATHDGYLVDGRARIALTTAVERVVVSVAGRTVEVAR